MLPSLDASSSSSSSLFLSVITDMSLLSLPRALAIFAALICSSHSFLPLLRLIRNSSGVIFNSFPIIAFQALPLILPGIPFQHILFTLEEDIFARVGLLSKNDSQSFFRRTSSASLSSSFTSGESIAPLLKNVFAFSAMLLTFSLTAIARSDTDHDLFSRRVGSDLSLASGEAISIFSFGHDKRPFPSSMSSHVAPVFLAAGEFCWLGGGGNGVFFFLGGG
mmetsp:Transcript_2313/g.3311  ORF Transcript_2313/g.3311 Transcript_2313/m.3311 type:complete len:221 (-) Transcript_2313:424-1086(-)